VRDALQYNAGRWKQKSRRQTSPTATLLKDITHGMVWDRTPGSGVTGVKPPEARPGDMKYAGRVTRV